ncbi:hypothetical protein PT510_04505 [Aliarcobacter butzleri]|uniref:hypothetical protein n=1 Tax=Aliarcobacter butzleri TaxID=28197 RepID=UPI0024DEE222|nr:hypothetical protein [Aliarcobacter butzleri]MDK2069855.1 hypothetical protein [Aliarcobacter butzleri]
MYCREEINSFMEKDNSAYRDLLISNIKREIESNSKDYILNVDEAEYLQYLEEKYKLFPLEIDKSSEHINEPYIEKKERENRDWGGTYTVEVYNIKVSYPYKGTKELFYIKPSTWTMTHYRICLSEPSVVSFIVKLTQKDAELFKREKETAFGSAFANVCNINNFVSSWNNGLKELVKNEFNRIKTKYKDENSFFAAINVKTNQEASKVFSVPTIKKIETPKPKLDGEKSYTLEPAMSDLMYKDVLDVIYALGRSMERKPSLHIGKDEESLRDQFLFALEVKYEGVTATGETFNKNGKTDILLKHEKDGSNLFIAECKIWHGQKQFLEAISQLFDRYLTWRDSKVAVMMFVKNKEMSNIVDTVKDTVSKHDYFVEELDTTSKDSSFSYKFHLKDDKEKVVFLEVMLFHFPEDN